MSTCEKDLTSVRYEVPRPSSRRSSTAPCLVLLCFTFARCTPEPFLTPAGENASLETKNVVAVIEEKASPAYSPRLESPAPSPRFEFASRFSLSLYDSFAQRALNLDSIVDDFLRATGDLSLTYSTVDKLEIGFFRIWSQYKDYKRSGRVMFLAESDGIVTAFATRRNVQAGYPVAPDPGVFGATIFGVNVAVTKDGTSTPKLKVVRVKSPSVTPPPSGTVHYRTLECNDIAMLYFNASDITPLRAGPDFVLKISQPDKEVDALIRESTTWIGEDFCLISKVALKELTHAANRNREPLFSKSGLLLLLLQRALPLFGRQTSRAELIKTLFSEVSERLALKPDDSAYLAASAMSLGKPPLRGPIAPVQNIRFDYRIFDESKSGLRFVNIDDESSSPFYLRLLGVRFPAAGSEQDEIKKFLGQIIASAPAQFVPFRTNGTSSEGLLFLSDQRVVMNVELLQHGLAQLDLGDTSVYLEFPELADAAASALRSGIGFAAQWKDDDKYVNEVNRLEKEFGP